MVLIDASTRWSCMYCYPQEIMLSMIICSNYQIKEHIIQNTQSNPSGLTMPINYPQKPSIIIVWLQALMWNIFVHTQNGLAKSLTKRITYLIDHYHIIAVNIMLASYGLKYRKLNSNSYNCYQNDASCCNKYVESQPQPNISHLGVGYISNIPISPPQHTSMGIEIHTRYLSVINKISWITHKGLIFSFTSPYVDYF